VAVRHAPHHPAAGAESLLCSGAGLLYQKAMQAFLGGMPYRCDRSDRCGHDR